MDATNATCNSLRGVYECSITPQYAGSGREVGITVSGMDASSIEFMSLLNQTVATPGPFPITLFPSVLSAKDSVVAQLPRSYDAGEIRRVFLNWQDRFGNVLIGTPGLSSFAVFFDIVSELSRFL